MARSILIVGGSGLISGAVAEQLQRMARAARHAWNLKAHVPTMLRLRSSGSDAIIEQPDFNGDAVLVPAGARRAVQALREPAMPCQPRSGTRNIEYWIDDQVSIPVRRRCWPIRSPRRRNVQELY